jgi:bifunctional DNA-binding transcriptional regulator/antitoxin component of YhaV-PrlF toxin-antitoxin module
MPLIAIPKSLREKLGDEGSDALIAVLNEQEKETENSVIKTAELRFEKVLTEELSGLREEMHTCIGSLREEMNKNDNSLREEMIRGDNSLREAMIRGDSTLMEAIQQSKTETIKWMFIFWVGQIGVLLGVLFTVVK